MNQRLILELEEEINGRVYRTYIPYMQQPFAEAHQASVGFANHIIEMEKLARENAEKAKNPEVVTPEVVEPAQ